MNEDIYGGAGTRALNEAKKLLTILYARDVLSIIHRRVQCKLKLVQLGFTVPDKKSDRLICGREDDEMYLFAFVRDRKRKNGESNIAGYRFDIAQYRIYPLAGVRGVRQAFHCFAFAVALVEGIDLRRCKREATDPSRN